MKKIAFLNLVFVISISSVLGQITNDSLFVKKFRGDEARHFFNTNNKLEKTFFRISRARGYYIYKPDKKFLLVESAEGRMKQNNDAYKLMMSAKSLASTKRVIEYGGSIGLLIYIIAAPPTGEDTQENIKYLAIIFGTEIGILIIGASLKNAAFKRTREAVSIYNSGLKKISRYPETQLRLGFTGNGIGLKVLF